LIQDEAKSLRAGRSFYAGLLEALIRVMGSANAYLYDHGRKVGFMAHQIGRAMGLSDLELARLAFASVLADLGMVGLAEDAWETPVRELPAEDRALVEEHPLRSQDRVAEIPHLESLAPLVRHHHEWWNGNGYPEGLAGEDIPLESRIIRVADTVVALGQDRPHRPACSPEEIAEIVSSGVGLEFAPQAGRAYLHLHREGGLRAFDATSFREIICEAADHLLPPEVTTPSNDQLLSLLASVIEAKDPYTAGHSRRVAILAVAVAGTLGLSDSEKSDLWAGGYLHDLGKVSVPLRVLSKAGVLSAEEFALVKDHPGVGADILESIPALRGLSPGVRYHHEWWNGSGYPGEVRGEEIPPHAQILAVCDGYDAMTSQRAYRDSRTHAEALEEIAVSSGVQFSPRVAAAFLALPDHLFEAVRAQRPEVFDPDAVPCPTSWGIYGGSLYSL